MRGAFLIWMCLTTVISSVARGQVGGVLIDSIASGRRIPGAVITVLDSANGVIARALADDLGRFHIGNAPGARRIRVAKIGYRPVERRVTPEPMRIAMERLPNLLEPLRTIDQPRCSRNSTRPAALGLWEQARAALLGTVLARASNTATVRRINYTRHLSPRGEDVLYQSVHREGALSLRSFDAVYSAAEFMQRGFAEVAGASHLQFYGPDAEVLLDDVLIEHYCLELANRQKARPTLVGLRFRPMQRQRGRVDIDGTLWIDTLARTLTDIEYSYLGLEDWATSYRPGGLISFTEISPATVWISDFNIRMTGADIDLGQRAPPRAMRPLTVTEGGAELASAFWPDGREWHATLGSAALKLAGRDGTPLVGARVQLDSTDYAGVTDSSGQVLIDELIPGPYRISVFDSTLAVVDTALPASGGFKAARGSTVAVRATVPTLRQFVARACVDEDAFDERSYMFVARILVGYGERPAARTRWRLEAPAGANDPNAQNNIYGVGETGPNGMVFFCAKLGEGKRVVLRAWAPGDRSGGSGTEMTVTLREQVTAVKLVVPK
jgi:hypothetical protein